MKRLTKLPPVVISVLLCLLTACNSSGDRQGVSSDNTARESVVSEFEIDVSESESSKISETAVSGKQKSQGKSESKGNRSTDTKSDNGTSNNVSQDDSEPHYNPELDGEEVED